jgi:hypothetical protein
LIQDPTDLNRNQVGLKKLEEELTRRLGQKPGCSSLIFFLLKRHHFDFFYKKKGPDDPVKTQNPGVEPDQI